MEAHEDGRSQPDGPVSWVEEELLLDGARSPRVRLLRRATARRGPAIRLAVVLPGWIVAAALTELAPFQPLVVVHAVGQGRSITVLDGWGPTPPDLRTTLPHGANFGVALSGCAGCLIALIVVVVIAGVLSSARMTSGVVDRVAEGLAIAAPCLLAGVTGSLLLYNNAYLDELRRITFERPPAVPISRDLCLWLAVAALVAAAISSALYLMSSPALRASAATGKTTATEGPSA